MTRVQALMLAAAITLGLTPALARAAGPDDALAAKIGDAKHSLLDGIAQAEKANGAAISAKFELEDGKVMLSVYTAKDGREKDAEHNTLMELGGDATAVAWEPKSEVFGDKEHLTRAAMHLTVMQLTKLSLSDLIKKAGAAQKGTVYSAIPAVKNGKAIVEVLVATADKKGVALNLDAQTGKAVK